MDDHRGSGFPAFSLKLLADLKRIFKTETGEVFIFPSSGTGAWEATLQNTLCPGDRVLASSFGTFSGLWVDMCLRLGMKVDTVESDWGCGVPIDRYRDILEADVEHSVRAVLVCHNETATGVASAI